MGGPNGVGFAGSEPRLVNLTGTGIVNGAQVDTTRPGSAPQNTAQHVNVSPQAQPSRAADVVSRLDVLLLKALNGASEGIKADDVTKAAKSAKLPKDVRENLTTLARTAQSSLAALDKFSGKDLASAMEKTQDGSMDWIEGNMVAKAFAEAHAAQENLSMALADALGKASNANTQATLEELRLQCDKRVAEMDTLVLQMAEIIDKGGANALDNAAALAKGGSISSFNSADAMDKFGRNEMFNALNADLQPLKDRLDQYANDSDKSLSKADVEACVRDLNALKAKFSAAAKSGFLEVGGKKVAVDRSLLGEASKQLDGVGKKIGAIHRDVLHNAMVKLVETDIPFVDEELFSPKFADEIGKLVSRDPNVKIGALADYVKQINAFRSAARTYADSPTKANATRLMDAAMSLAETDTDDVQACVTMEAIASLTTPAGASEELKVALANFKGNMIKDIGGEGETPMARLTLAYGNIDIAAEKLIALGKEFNAGPSSKYFVSGAVLDVFTGATSLSTLVESRVHGYSDTDINLALDDKNVTGAKTLGAGNSNTVTLVTVKDGSEWVFKPEMAGRLHVPNSPLNNGMNADQEITRINLAVQTAADTLGLDDIMVKTSAGTHKGQFGMFMEKAPGITGKKFKNSSNLEIKEMNDADFGKVVGDMMRKFNRLQWFDIITGQGDRHADNYMINVNKGVPPSVDIKAIDNDASYGVFRQGLHKFVLKDEASTGGMAGSFMEKLERLAEAITVPKIDGEPKYDHAKRVLEAREDFKQTILKDPGVTQNYDGSIAIDLAKSKNPQLLRSLLKSCAMKNVAPPEEIDRQLYDKLMTLAKNAPDGGVARKNYLSSIAQRLGKNSEQYKAAVQRLDESIEYARKLEKEGKVYKEEDWENHDIQRDIAKPNLDNMEEKYGAKMDEAKKNAANGGKYVSYSNTFFRDFYEVLIKGSPHQNWFTQKSQ